MIDFLVYAVLLAYVFTNILFLMVFTEHIEDNVVIDRFLELILTDSKATFRDVSMFAALIFFLPAVLSFFLITLICILLISPLLIMQSERFKELLDTPLTKQETDEQEKKRGF